MPTFVFAPASDLGKFLALEESPISPHPDFSVFRYHGRIPLLADRDLGPLRTEEGRAALARRKTLRHAFTKGQEVEVPEGAFAGLTGKVEKDSSGKFALVCFGEFRVRVASFLLQANGVGGPEPVMGAAA